AAVLTAGAAKVSDNPAGVTVPAFVRVVAAGAAARCVVVAIDARRRVPDDPTHGWEGFTHGGRKPTGLDALDWAAHMEAAGAGEILLTSMDRDGKKEGYDPPLTRPLVDRLDIPVLASGGSGTPGQLH